MAFPKIDGYLVTQRLGAGSYSTVYKAYTKVGARTCVAIKCVDKSRVKHSETAVDNLITEIRLLKTIRHPHIVEMKDFIWDDRNIYIMTEFCAGGDLSQYIRRNGRVPEKQVRFFLQQLAAALRFLRSRGVVHMDLKPHNLLLDKASDGRYTLKVADFGFALYMEDETLECGVRGSPLYMAPEMFGDNGYDASVDLWSVGVIMYEALFGRAPYSSHTFRQLMAKIRAQAPVEVPLRCSISAGCRDLLHSLLQPDPKQRVSYEDFFNNEYLDLEHMPNEQNYEKAVSLITSAVKSDAQSDYTAALPLYCEALRYLVPRVSVEGEARKRALTEKVDSYMRRAEDLKAFLKNGVPLPLPAPPAGPPAGPSRGIGCCVKGTESIDSPPFQRQLSSSNGETDSVSALPDLELNEAEGSSAISNEIAKEEKPDKVPVGESTDGCKIA